MVPLGLRKHRLYHFYIKVPELNDFHEEDGRGEDENIVDELEKGAQAETHAEGAHQRHENRQRVTRRPRLAPRLDFNGVTVGAEAGVGHVALFEVGGAQLWLPGRVEGFGDG